MDLKRLLFVIPLAVVTYLMVIQWNQDYHQPKTPQPETPALASQGSDAKQSNSLDAPSTTDELSVDATKEPASSGSSKLISVDTDVLNLRIDPRGGDIVYASLPRHTQQLGGNQPFVLLANEQAMNYVAKSGLELSNHKGRITFSPEKTAYRLSDEEKTLTVDLKATLKGLDITKRFTFERDSYEVKVDYLVRNGGTQPVSARFIGQLVRDNSDDPTSGAGVGMHSYLGAAFSTTEEPYQKVSFEDIKEGNFKRTESEGGWVAIIQHYFVAAWVPDAKQQNLFYATEDSQNRNVAAFASPNTQIGAGEEATLDASLYAGPKIHERLEAIAPKLDRTIDFGWLWFLATPLFLVLKFIHGLIGNWGWSIILLTCFVKAVLFPLSAKAYKSMAKMRKMQPEMQRIKEAHGDDRQKMSQEMMKFYQKEKINPLGGCLPMVIQMPVFIALYWMLMESIELRHAPFMLWIHDLSAQDPYFILPILMGLSMFVQQQLNPTPPDPTQAKIMKMLPIIFTFFFLWFPAGLVLYWITNNCLSIAQQYYVTRQIEKQDQKKQEISK
ncbi:membrane protein insertase YidC [Larsenimonas suaedae]|uniref:Membrane protein insertase YidC n=1 Tax=Larsenimonas suaedae TaxID=1851019 RepID=A0ABU1GR57_9GAMM|nr:membrane protein insertase YidC [Larsenimonas suaedae]MCM2972694.1 membrane protein insertase YidC [Larsenimonas suaedae]MDR5894509.1 membrane protein insertase YidC [Larsenimonas suaedae]